MNALIVDDDRFVIASLQKGIKWNDLGFHQVYTAVNIQEAKRIIEREAVDFLLSDIDMPNGSGLELLTWLRERHNDLPVVILTNYADFSYAQKAIELKSFQYLLKPIAYEKLSAVIREATGQLARRQLEAKSECENFWKAFLNGHVSGPSEEPSPLLSQFQLPDPYRGDMLFAPIMFDVSQYYLDESGTLKSCFEEPDALARYIRTTYYAVFGDVSRQGDVLFEYDATLSRYLAVIQADGPGRPPAWRMRCEQFVAQAQAQTGAVVTCYLGIPSTLERFHANFAVLCSMMNNQIDGKDRILDSDGYHRPADDYLDFPAEVLRQHLDNAQYAAFQNSCFDYLRRLTAKGCLHEKSITSFQLNVAQMLYSFLAGRGILADKLYNNETYHILAGIAKKSLGNMKMYITYISNAISDYFDQESADISIALAIKEYVDQHYNEDIFRADLSKLFHIDAAYAVRLFKKEFGLSFKNYVIDKRIGVAKELLVTTDLPINTISDSVGYGNYSYFTRIFKKITGSTPMEFRNQFSAGGDSSPG